jgi:signal transduction histidine kinase
VIGLWSIPIVLDVFAVYVAGNEVGRPVSAARSVWLGIGNWASWVVVTPVVVRLGQRWPLDRAKRFRFAAQHLAAAVAIAAAAAACGAILVYRPDAGTSLTAYAQSRMARGTVMGAVLYFMVLGVSYLAINTRRLQEREVLAERLSRELAEAHLAALRMQLHPHFLFNSLNAIMALVRDRATDRADRALTMLSDMLRTSLRHEKRLRVPLKEEVDFIRNYLAIETLRFGDRLNVDITVAADVADVAVPTFVLQPLVENALRHGLLDLPRGGMLRIGAERRSRSLVVEVIDDGVGLPADWEARVAQGLGIRSVRARLESICGAGATVRIRPRAGGTGTSVTIELPIESAL